jgi:hypothetical protein
MVEWLTLLFRIREVPGLNFGPGTGYPDRVGRDAGLLIPFLVPTPRMSRRYTASPPCRLHDGSGTALLLLSSVLEEHIPSKTA